MSRLKGSVSTISSDPLCKYVNARFTTVPLKVLSDELCIKYQYFQFRKLVSIILQENWTILQENWSILQENWTVLQENWSIFQETNWNYQTLHF